MNVENLMKSLDDISNENLFNFTTKKMREMNLNILKELHLSKKDTLEIFKKIKDYKYVDEMSDLKYGTYIRWIPLEDPTNIYLTRGALFCELQIKENGVHCICKNIGFNSKYFQISMDKNLIFQKLTNQELVLLSALDHLAN
jgi:hypothetical protein